MSALSSRVTLSSQFLTAASVCSACLFLFISCEVSGDGVIDYHGTPPIAISGSVSPSLINTDTVNIGPERLPGDLLSLSVNAQMKVAGSAPTVRFSVYRERSFNTLSEGTLLDDGIFPDSSASDSVFSGRITFQMLRSVVGTVTVEMTAESDGLQSSALLHMITIERLNQAPVLSNFNAPDTVRLGQQLSFLITVMAVDPDGQSDIKSVTRQTPANNIFPLNDTGVNGDASAGDMIFTETVSLPSNTPTGDYTFTFQALDRSDVSSNIITHTITVQP